VRVTERTIHDIVIRILESQATTEPLRGTVTDVPPGRYLMAKVGGSDVPVPIWRPSLPVIPVAGDQITINRGPGGYLVVGAVLNRDPVPFKLPDDDDGEPFVHDLATHVKLGLVQMTDLISHAASSEHLIIYNTPNTLTTGDGKWSQIATGSIPERFGSLQFQIVLNGAGSNGTTWARGQVRARIRQQDDFGTDPTVDIELVDGADIDAADIVVVVTDNAGPTTFEIHVRLDREYEWLTWIPLWTYPERCEFDWTGCQAFATSLPAGTQTAAVAV